jgi:hypothetical protein
MMADRNDVDRNHPVRGDGTAAGSATSTASDHAADWEQTSAVDPQPTWRPTSEQAEVSRRPWAVELPPVGYPVSQEAVTHWFLKEYQRTPLEAEVGAILDAMAERDAGRPATEPPTETVLLDR